jgi:hypothetical protein
LCKWKDGRRRRKVRKNATLTDEIWERKDAAGDNPAFPALKLSKVRHFIFPLSVQAHNCNKICCLFTQPLIWGNVFGYLLEPCIEIWRFSYILVKLWLFHF